MDSCQIVSGFLKGSVIFFLCMYVCLLVFLIFFHEFYDVLISISEQVHGRTEANLKTAVLFFNPLL